MESRNGGTAERRKIARNPKRRNDGQSTQILIDGITEVTKADKEVMDDVHLQHLRNEFGL